jgi:hypothetical protein
MIKIMKEITSDFFSANNSIMYKCKKTTTSMGMGYFEKFVISLSRLK